jgi:hypothetical protein
MSNPPKIIRLYSSVNELVRVIRILRPIIRNREVLLIGSAPFSIFNSYHPGMKVVNINGSCYRNRGMGILKADVTFLDYEVLDPTINDVKENRRELIENGILSSTNLGILVQTQSNDSTGGDPSAYDLCFDNKLWMNRLTRRLLLFLLCRNFHIESGKKSILSTGGLALATVAFLKPKSITLTGFSFFKSIYASDPPKAYNLEKHLIYSDLEDTRSHSSADSFLISFLSLRNENIFSKDKDLLPLINNWGTKYK